MTQIYSLLKNFFNNKSNKSGLTSKNSNYYDVISKGVCHNYDN